MAKQISQETFDGVVKENMDDFEMGAEEAMNDAIQQFDAQGINLANIIKDVSIYEGQSSDENNVVHKVVSSINGIKESTSKDEPEILVGHLNEFKEQCDIDLAHRILAGKSDGYSAVFLACKKHQSDKTLLDYALTSFISLCNGQPDLLDEDGITWTCEILRNTIDSPQQAALIVQLIKLNCVKHERNRQKYVACNIIALLSQTLDKYRDDADVLREICSMFRVLTHDDDVRVPFGKGHEHAKIIVTEEKALMKIMDICKNFNDNGELLSELFHTLTRLSVRNEFCQEIMDLGGVKLVLGAIENNEKNQGLIKHIFGVLKAIAGNDQVKVAIVDANGIELILLAFDKHIRSAAISEMGCSALAMIALRMSGHAEKIMASGGAETIVKSMQIHREKPSVQKQACMAIRNIVARSKTYNAMFIEFGVEELLNLAMRNHEDCHDEAKAALRDLELKVDLKELWKGTGREIHS